MAKTTSQTSSPLTKRKKLSSLNSTATSNSTEGLFNAFSTVDNSIDLKLTDTSIPLLPRDAKIVLLDIEGTTTSISFVKDVLFPYALEKLPSHLRSLSSQKQMELLQRLQLDIKRLDSNHPAKIQLESNPSAENEIVSYVETMMKHDVKATGLKQLQGDIWKHGYMTSHELKGHVYQDFKPFLQWCESHSVQVHIYSSGSVGAQKLLFGHSINGNLLNYINNHYDTTVGSKKESSSYENIAKYLKVSLEDIVFISDSESELVAAKKAGIVFAVMSVRLGNVPLTTASDTFPKIYSLLQVCGTGS